MATIVAAAGGGNWGTGATWTGGLVPTAADDVQLSAGSGNVTIDVASVCRSLDCTGYVGTLTHAAAITLTIGDGTAGTGNIALKLVAGMTYTLGNAATSAISFISTSATQQTIETGGKALGNWTVNGVGCSYLLADVNTTGAAATVTLTSGTLNTGGQTCSWGILSSSNSNIRTMTLGASSITITGNSWAFTTATNLTFNANTSTITFSGAATTIQSGGKTYYNLSFTGAGVATLAGIPVISNNLTRIGTAAKTDSLAIGGTGITITVGGTFTANGNSATNRLLINALAVGTASAIAAATVVVSNTDFQDIIGSGAGSWNLSAITGDSGNCGGNTNITFTTAATQTWQGTVGGNWSDVTKWTSRVPLPQDDVNIGSAFIASQTINMDMPRSGRSISFAGSSGGLTLNPNTVTTIFGSLNLTGIGVMGSSTAAWTFGGRNTYTITMAGFTLAKAVTFTAPSGTYTLQDAFVSTGTLSVTYGTLATAGFTVTIPNFVLSGTNAALVLSTSTINLTAITTGPIWSVTSGTLNAGTSTIVIANASINDRTFAGGGLSYATLSYTVANSPGALIISGANTFATLSVTAGRTLTMPSSTTTSITNAFNVTGAPNGYVYLPGLTGNYISAANAAPLQITGDMTLDVRVALDDWTPTGEAPLVTKFGAAGSRGYFFAVEPSGILRFEFSSDGTTDLIKNSTVATGFTDGTTNWVRMSFDADNGAGGYDVKFYTSPDGTTWTQLGTTVTTATPTGIFASTAQLRIGNYVGGSGTLAIGKFYNVKIYNSYLQTSSGTPVFNADLITKAVGANTFAESSANAATVTMTGTLTQVGDGRVSIVSSTPATAATLSKTSGVANSNYLTIQDSTATGGASWYAGVNSTNVSNNTGWFFQAYSSSKFLELM